MRQLIKRILKEQIDKGLTRIITKILETSILPKYEGIVCGIKVIAPKDRETIEPGKEFLHYKINVYFIGGPGTKFYPKTMEIRERYDKIMYEIWDVVESYTGEPADIFSTYVEKCDNNINEEYKSSDFEYSPKTLKVVEKILTRLELPKVKKTKVVWDEKDGVYLIKLYYGEDYNQFRSVMVDNERKVDRFVESFLNLPPYTINVVSYVFREDEPQNKEEETEGVGAYAAPAFEMKPDHVHFKHLYNEEDDDVESNDDNYSPQTIKMIKRVVNKIDLPMVDKIKVLWSEEQGMYRVQLYYPEGVSRDIKWKNELTITGPIKSFLDLPPYTLMVGTYIIPDKN